MAQISRIGQVRATREEHLTRMQKTVRLLTVDGRSPARTAATIAEEHECSQRQAWRYIRAVRKLYAARAIEDQLSLEEHLRILLARSEDALAGAKPDYSASVKALELYARMRGWLDKRSTVNVNVNGTVQHVHALDGASDAEIAALQAYHAALRARLEAAPIETTAVDADTPSE